MFYYYNQSNFNPRVYGIASSGCSTRWVRRLLPSANTIKNKKHQRRRTLKKKTLSTRIPLLIVQRRKDPCCHLNRVPVSPGSLRRPDQAPEICSPLLLPCPCAAPGCQAAGPHPGEPLLHQMVGTWGQVMFPIAWKDFRIWYKDNRYRAGRDPGIRYMRSTGWWRTKVQQKGPDCGPSCRQAGRRPPHPVHEIHRVVAHQGTAEGP